jgi:hypothetical protein
MKNKFLKIVLSFTIFSSYEFCCGENNVSLISISKFNNCANSNFESSIDNSIVFIDENDNSSIDEIELVSENNQHSGKLFSKFHFSDPNKKDLVEGELYKTKYDTKESLNNLKQFILNKANNNTLCVAYNYDEEIIDYGNFDIGNSYIPLRNATKIRAMSCAYNGNVLGVLTDYENIFVLNNPKNSETFYLLVTHQTYLSPTQTSNKNYKGVGVEFKLSKDKFPYVVTRYAPTASSPSKVTSFSTNLGVQLGEQNSVSTNVSFTYQKTVNSPKILSKGSISEGLVDISFEYVEPGSWYGDFCDYNSGETFQCSLVVLESSKLNNEFGYLSSVTGRFQKYENWPFPWVDEYYTLNQLAVSEILARIS